MSDQSICKFVKCSALSVNGCEAYINPVQDCPVGKLGFLKNNQIFQESCSFAKMKEIYECVHLHLVESVICPEKYIIKLGEKS